MTQSSVLEILAQGAWNGGIRVDNSIYVNQGMKFKGNIPVNNDTIEERIGIRTRMAAPRDERIGVTALKDLLDQKKFDPKKIKLVIGATNVGDDKHDGRPLIRFAYDILKQHCPNALVFDLYAGCPGFNVAAELNFMLALTGVLKAGDISIIIGAENIHRAKAFKPGDTSNIIFGDDALATALETRSNMTSNGRYTASDRREFSLGPDFIRDIARGIIELNGGHRIDGIILDNQLGEMKHRIPALAARVQQHLVELMYPEEARAGLFSQFKSAIMFYGQHVKSFAFDINSLGNNKAPVEQIARAYVESGRYNTIVSAYVGSDKTLSLKYHQGDGFVPQYPETGIVDSCSITHGCFGDYIQAITENDDIFGEIDGKGVFLYATRSAAPHLRRLLSRNSLTIDDVELLIEHQANFAMIPLTLEQVLQKEGSDIKKEVMEFIANKTVINIHERGNCSVVCMQRLPYDLERNALKEDMVQGFPINMNTRHLKNARIVLYDSVGAGMTRSSFLMKT